MENESLRVGKIFREAWEFTKDHLGFLIGYFIITIVLSLLFTFVGDALEEKGYTFFSVLMHLAGTIVNLFVSMGFYRSALMITAGEKPGYDQLYSNDQNFVSWLLSNLLFGLIITIGFLLLIIPGLYLIARYGLYPYFLLDRDLGPMEAIKEAGKASEGKRWQLFLLYAACFLANIVGLLLLGVGMLVTVPLTLLVLAVAYRKITGSQQTTLITPE